MHCSMSNEAFERLDGIKSIYDDELNYLFVESDKEGEKYNVTQEVIETDFSFLKMARGKQVKAIMEMSLFKANKLRRDILACQTLSRDLHLSCVRKLKNNPDRRKLKSETHFRMN